MINYNYLTEYYYNSLNNALITLNLTTDEVESYRERLTVIDILILIKSDANYLPMMNAAIFGISKGLTDSQILDCVNEHFNCKQMCALMDLVANGISDDMLKLLKQRTHIYNVQERDYIPHIDEVEEIRLAQQRTKNHNIKHANLNDLTEMNNRRGFCSHYYFVNNEPKSFITNTEHGNLYCMICHRRISNSIANRLDNAIKNFDIDSECAIPNSSHYDTTNPYRREDLRKIGIV